MREIGVLAVADDEHGCESSGGKGRRTATRRREARRRVGVLWRTPSGARTLTVVCRKGDTGSSGDINNILLQVLLNTQS